MTSLIVTIIVSIIFAFCLIPVSIWFHSVMLALSFTNDGSSLVQAAYITMHVIYAVCLLYFIVSATIYLINKYKTIKGFEPSTKLVKKFHIANYVMLIINASLPLIIAKTIDHGFTYNFATFFIGNGGTILGVLLLQIVSGDYLKQFTKEPEVKEEPKAISNI